MIFRIFRHALGAAVLACVVSTACNSPPPPPPDTFIDANLSSSMQSPSEQCQLGVATSALAIGTATGTKPTTVTDGNTQSGGPVHVTCTVTPSGAGFDVSLYAALGGPNGGSITITSPGGQGAVSSAGMGSNITATLGSLITGHFSENGDCTISPMYQRGPVPADVGPPVAAGRIFAHLSCPTAQLPNQPVTLMDGGSAPRQCDAEADILFENCNP